MEQRVLLASALVLGCVTAASAGGFLAMRQADAPPPSRQPARPRLQMAAPSWSEATVADIALPGEPVEPTRAPVSPAPPAGDEQQHPPAASADSTASDASPCARTSAGGACGISSRVFGIRAGLGASDG